MPRLAFALVLLSWVAWTSRAGADARAGALVLAKTAAVLAPAKSLARATYREPALRPKVDEATARVILGDPLPENPPEKLAELARVRAAALEATDAAVSTRLLASLGRDLGIELMVVVEPAVEGQPPTARVLTVSEGRYLPMLLSPKIVPPPAGHPHPGSPADAPKPATAELDWAEVVPVLRGLAQPAPPATTPAPAKTPGVLGKPGPKAPPTGDKGKKKNNVLTSPWFWGGLGAVVAVGVTVLVLSQTALNEPNKIILDGRISP
jgi:hypothetical protein